MTFTEFKYLLCTCNHLTIDKENLSRIFLVDFQRLGLDVAEILLPESYQCTQWKFQEVVILENDSKFKQNSVRVCYLTHES